MYSEKDEILLHDYFDNLLTQEQQTTFEDYIVNNIDLAIDLGRLKNLRRNLKNMPSNFTPPDTVIENIISSLLGNKEKIDTFLDEPEIIESVVNETEIVKKKIKGKKRLRPKTKYKLKKLFSYSLILFVLCIVGYSYFIFKQKDITTPWVAQIIVGEDISNLDSLSLELNSILKTNDSESHLIKIADKGLLELTGNTQIKVLTATQSLNAINYSFGNLAFKPKGNNELFEIKYNGLSITSRNSEFSIQENKNLVSIKVITNSIEVNSGLNTFRIPKNYQFNIVGKNEISIPLNNKSPEYFQKLVENYSISKDDSELEKIIEISGRNEAFTLHFLLSKVTPFYREKIIAKLSEISPIQFAETKEKLLLLDQSALDDWWELIYISIN